MRGRTAFPVLAILLLPACSGSATHSPHASTGVAPPIPRSRGVSPGVCCDLLTRVSGIVQIVGGPALAGAAPRPDPHQVLRILDDGTVVRRIRTDGAARFKTRLRPGVYVISPFFITPRVLRVGTVPVSVQLTVNAM